MKGQYEFYTEAYEKYVEEFRQGEKLIEKYYLPLLKELGAKTVLDLGCGPGTSKILVDHGFEVVGVDQSQPFVQMASKYYQAIMDDIRTLGHDRTKFKDRIPFDAAIAVFTTVPHMSNARDIIHHFRATNKVAKYYIFDFPAFVNLAVSPGEAFEFDRVGRVKMKVNADGKEYGIMLSMITPLFVDTIAPLTGWRVEKRLADGREFNANDKIFDDVCRFVYVLKRREM